jgi:hypothetical protein
MTVPEALLAPPQADSQRVSLARILADPERLHGKAVRVGGFAHFAFEGNSLCLHRDDVEYLVVTNCVWLDVRLAPEVEALSDRYVAVVGVVDAHNRGHMGMYQAALTDISGLGAQPRRDELESSQASGKQ